MNIAEKVWANMTNDSYRILADYLDMEEEQLRANPRLAEVIMTNLIKKAGGVDEAPIKMVNMFIRACYLTR